MGKDKNFSIILQVAIFFMIGIVTTGMTTYIIQRLLSDNSVKQQTEVLAREIADEVNRSVKEYPAYDFLLRYWYEHSDEMEIEYDAEYSQGTLTGEKVLAWTERHPDLAAKYVTVDQLEQLPEEDQKLYAEITYSWLITRIDEIKQSYKVDYLFCVVTDPSFESQFFLFSAAEPDSVRGTNYEEVYPIGVKVSVAENESQVEGMREATEYSSHLADAGNYVDYYAYLSTIDDHPVLVGLTFNLTPLRESIESQTWRGTAYAVFHQILLSVICLMLIYLFILSPLKSVQKSIQLYKKTKDSKTVAENLQEIQYHNEIGHLSRDVVSMTSEIDHYVEQIGTITADKERIQTELSLAAGIQESMLPSHFPAFPDHKEFDIFASMVPAKEVGGDFYDFFMMDEDHLAMVIADVSGKGVPAALFMMVSMILIHNTALTEKSPAKILKLVNDQIAERNEQEMFVSVWLGILEISTGKLTAANAGHEYPMIKDPEGHFEVIKKTHGFVVGAMPGIGYKDYEMILRPNTKLFVYTDGVPEATSENNELFGLERTVEALRSKEEGTPKMLLDAVNEAVKTFVGNAPQFDDMTMLCMHYQGLKTDESTF